MQKVFIFGCLVACCPSIYHKIELRKENTIHGCTKSQLNYFKEIADSALRFFGPPAPEEAKTIAQQTLDNLTYEFQNPYFQFSHIKGTQSLYNATLNVSVPVRDYIFKLIVSRLFGMPYKKIQEFNFISANVEENVLIFIRCSAYQPKRNTQNATIKKFVQKFPNCILVGEKCTESLPKTVHNFTQHWLKLKDWKSDILTAWGEGVTDLMTSTYRSQLWILYFISKKYNVRKAFGTWSGVLESLVLAGMKVIRLIDSSASISTQRRERVKKWCFALNKDYCECFLGEENNWLKI
jgi:hypothetical protein